MIPVSPEPPAPDSGPFDFWWKATILQFPTPEWLETKEVQ